jgi:hypothetical protein
MYFNILSIVESVFDSSLVFLIIFCCSSYGFDLAARFPFRCFALSLLHSFPGRSNVGALVLYFFFSGFLLPVYCFMGSVTIKMLDIFVKNGVFWDVTSCGSCKNRRFEGT